MSNVESSGEEDAARITWSVLQEDINVEEMDEGEKPRRGCAVGENRWYHN